MKKRLAKKIKKEEIRKILSLHWQRLLTDEEARDKIEKEMVNAAQLGKLPPSIKALIKTKIWNIVEETIQRNKESNGRYIKRIKLFSIEELTEDLSRDKENMEIHAGAERGK